MSESCGKCVPCRVGTAQMHDLLVKIIEKRATDSDVRLLNELCDMVQSTSLCGLGQTAPNPVLSTLRYFPEEYEALVQAGREREAAGSNGSAMHVAPQLKPNSTQPQAHVDSEVTP